MPDNPQAAPRHAFALPGHAVVTLEGRDAAAFAQAQFMNDVNALDAGHWQWSGWLTPKGRVIALFALLRISDEKIWLVLPDADASAFVAALKRFVFRSKVSIAVREDLPVSARFQAPEQALGSAVAGDEAQGFEFDLGGDGNPRSWRIAADAAPANDDAVAQWAAADLRHGLPRLSPAQVEQWTPQQLSLERLRAFSVKKGCYPGQEIVARTHFLGKAKRGLVAFSADAPLTVGAEVRGATAAQGTLVAVADERETHWGLGVLPLEREAQALSIDGHAVREQPLLGGLAR